MRKMTAKMIRLLLAVLMILSLPGMSRALSADDPSAKETVLEEDAVFIQAT